jgi:hypothetical protein
VPGSSIGRLSIATRKEALERIGWYTSVAELLRRS